MLPASWVDIELIGLRLKKLLEEARAIEEEEIRLEASDKNKTGYETKKRHLMERTRKCFGKIRTMKQDLQEFCGHEDKEMVGSQGSWCCNSCGKVNYEAPPRL
ncbi:MAG: hypothetical protein Q7S36_03545 [Candidatus Liptonbacteria bacterium]|nr:hypothetical protein [Candidatus Liptonbacteria bacterium]